jgi:putative ABC transport system permease protein
MFNLDQAVKDWLKTLRKKQELEEGYIEELHSHLWDEIDHLLEEGKNKEKAFAGAVKNLGPIESIGVDYFKTDSRKWIAVPPGKRAGSILALLANYFKVALRRVKKNRGYSVINVLGLAMGMACTIFIFKWVQNELSYDRFHQNAADLYAATFSNGSTVTPTALAKFLKAEFPEIVHTSRFADAGDNLVKYKGREMPAGGNGIIVDPDFLRMFTFRFLRGDATTALTNPLSIVISENIAAKFFGNENPVDKIVTFSAQFDLQVTGVFKNYPANSHIQCEYIIPLAAAKEWGWFGDLNTWNINDIRTYVQLAKNTAKGSVDAKLAHVVERHRPQDKRPLSLQPVTRLRLNPMGQREGTITYVYIFSAMAFFILIIACINFMNLTTARSTTLAREVGIRKTMGAGRADLIRQFFGETIALTVIALVVGTIMIALFLPNFNRITQEAFSFASLFQAGMIPGIFLILLLTAIISGSYPALFLSGFQTVRVLKGDISSAMSGARLRKILVVTQFFLSVLLILSTIMIFKQVNFLKDRDVGFNRENVVYFSVGARYRNNIETIKTELLANPKILNVTMADTAPFRWVRNAGVGDVQWEGKSHQQVKMVMAAVDSDYLKTFGMKMAQGRFFSKKFASDAAEAFVVNETAVKAMEMESPLGKQLQVGDWGGRIIGVVKDYHFESLRSGIIPLAMRIQPDSYRHACIRVHPRNMASTLNFLKKHWTKIYPEYPFEYSFLDDSIRDQYQVEESVGRLVLTFTVLAIFISCLGLFGLASFMTEKRTKEIGIRKACGASTSALVFLLTKDFLRLVLLACMLATPLAAILVNKWLRIYACRTVMGPGVIALTVLLATAIAFVTVGFHTIKSARLNPSASLRYE